MPRSGRCESDEGSADGLGVAPDRSDGGGAGEAPDSPDGAGDGEALDGAGVSSVRDVDDLVNDVRRRVRGRSLLDFDFRGRFDMVDVRT